MANEALKYKIKVNGGRDFIEVEKVSERLKKGSLRTYLIVSNSITEDGNPLSASTGLGYRALEGAENLDFTSDTWQCGQISGHIFVKSTGVTFLDTSDSENLSVRGKIMAPSISSIKSSVESLEFCSYCPGDI